MEDSSCLNQLSAVYIHLIFSTKERFPYLKDEQLQRDLHAYLGETSKRLDCPPIRVGGVEDLACKIRTHDYAS
jgi:hypothetical protein